MSESHHHHLNHHLKECDKIAELYDADESIQKMVDEVRNLI
jgi:hypothetical protein